MWVPTVASGSSGSGPYTYTITRNLDGSGANNWTAGDAVFNTGTTNSGFIDLYSSAGVISGSGPTIVGNVRTGTTYNNTFPGVHFVYDVSQNVLARASYSKSITRPVPTSLLPTLVPNETNQTLSGGNPDRDHKNAIEKKSFRKFPAIFQIRWPDHQWSPASGISNTGIRLSSAENGCVRK